MLDSQDENDPSLWLGMNTNNDTCPCRHHHQYGRPFRSSSATRWLQENDDGGGGNADEEDDEVLLWQVLYTCGVLFFMFAALLSDRYGADSVMITALTLFLASGIITVEEGLAGFANQGLLTVLTLFVVADGISKTGALDWYMGKLLGRPTTAASAQLRLMIPISIVSAFLNNTPVVAVMIPIVQRWARNIHISAQQLLIPLSFASILGGTCTLIGTSTNLVVVGLLEERYPNDPSVSISLFELGQFGVPIAMAGIAYIVLASPFLLPGGSGSSDGDKNGNAGGGAINLDSQEDVLLGARLTPWSPAAGRSVKRSGLRDTGGIYLVSVHRAATGNVHRAVGQDFVLNVGDVLYFTGLIEGFGEFCEEHGLEVLTHTNNNNNNNNNEGTTTGKQQQQDDETKQGKTMTLNDNNTTTKAKDPSEMLGTVVEEDCGPDAGDDCDCHEAVVPCEVGVTMESLMNADEAERSRSITRMIDLIRGHAREEPTEREEAFSPRGHHYYHPKHNDLVGAQKVVVTSEHEFVVVGINAPDRPGLLLDISKGLSRLGLNLRHTEASVVEKRSISIWRCELIDSDLPDLEEIWSVLNALLENDGGSQAVKQRGIRVIRAVVTKTSKLIGKTVTEIDFRKSYKAGIIAIQKGGKNVALSGVVFGSGDVLVVQASEDSPLLKTPPEDFYKRISESQNKDAGTMSRSGSIASFIKNTIIKSRSNVSLDNGMTNKKDSDDANNESTPQQDLEEGQIGNGNGDSSDEEYNVGSGISLTEHDDAAEKNNNNDHEIIISDMQAVMADEEAWKDLQVIIANTNNEEAGAREFLAAMEVAPKSQLANRTVAESGLDKLPGVYLVSIDRPKVIAATAAVTSSTTTPKKTNVSHHNHHHHQNDEGPKNKVQVITRRADGSFNDDLSAANNTLQTAEPVFTAVPPETPLKEGDVLWYAGSASAVGDLRKVPGLISFESEEVKKMAEKVHDRRLVEAVVARRGPLVGKTVKEVRFRTKFGAAVIAVHREGKRIHDHPGKIKLQAGDVLLLEAGPSFIRGNIESDKSFALVAEVEDSAPPRLSLLIPALVITVLMLAVFTAGVAPLLVCALVASVLMVCLGILSEQEARDAVNWEVYIIIAAAFGIGTAMVNSGVASGVANFLVDVGEAIGIGDAGLLGAVYFATFLISNVVTNNAAAALLFPIALDAADQTGVDRKIMSYCLMLGASASFMSPFGYTTNLLIYGPGGYKYKDFLSIGTPMQVILWILSIALLSTTSSNWWISWLGTFVALILVLAGGSLKRLVVSLTSKSTSVDVKSDKLSGVATGAAGSSTTGSP